MLKGLWGLVTSGAGCRDAFVIPGGMCAAVALARPHLVQPTRCELGEAYEQMGLERGGVGVACRVRPRIFPFFDQETTTLELELRLGATRGEGWVKLELRVGATRGEGWVKLAEEVLGGHP